jgi:MFS family permease
LLQDEVNEGEEEKKNEGVVPSNTPISPAQKFLEGMRVLKEDPLQRLLLLIYSINSFSNGALFAIFLFSLSEPAEKGGIGLSTMGAGMMVSWSALVGIIYQISCFKKVSSLLSNFKLYRFALLVFLFYCFVFPFCALPNYLHASSNKTSAILVSFVSIFQSLGMMNALSVVTSMQSNITPPQMQGLALGTSQTISSLCRAFGPLLAGLLFDGLSQFRLGPYALWLVACCFFTCLMLIQRMSEQDKWRAQESRFTST